MEGLGGRQLVTPIEQMGREIWMRRESVEVWRQVLQGGAGSRRRPGMEGGPGTPGDNGL